MEILNPEGCRREGKMTFSELALRERIHALPAGRHPGYAFWTDAGHNIRLPNHEYGGLAAVVFPYVAPGSDADPGKTCLGCSVTHSDLQSGLMPMWARHRVFQLLDAHTPNDARRISQVEKDRARCWDEHWRHVRGCWGVKRLMLEDGKRLKLFLDKDGIKEEGIALMRERIVFRCG